MTRADLEAAAAEKYGPAHDPNVTRSTDRLRAERRKAYIQGRLDQAEADAQIAEKAGQRPEVVPIFDTARRHALIKGMEIATDAIAAAIREGVE